MFSLNLEDYLMFSLLLYIWIQHVLEAQCVGTWTRTCKLFENNICCLQDYVNVYHGHLVDSSHFINMFYERFEHLMTCSKEILVQDWLHSPGIPAGMHEIELLQKHRSSLFAETCDSYKDFISNVTKAKKKRKHNLDKLTVVLR